MGPRFSGAPRPPLPDLELVQRVGRLEVEDPLDVYERYGHRLRDEIVSLLPQDWEWDSKRVLDFGCGAGRILRHFLDEAEVAEFHGSDIDRPSIDWLQCHLSPPLHLITNDEAPPLALETSTFDLVYATSVFTHITDHWAAWLLELHRILKPSGILIATFHGPGMYSTVTGQREDEDRIGMNVIGHSRSWNEGGPGVMLSRWWIKAHWGRAFEILDLRPQGFTLDGEAEGGQGVTVMRPKPDKLTEDDLRALESGEGREVVALQTNIEQLHQEDARIRGWLDELQRSASWRLTAPLRTAKGLVRSRRK
jgi:SAM-dependent methyltransferase